jgi:hypothetical protein
MFGTLPPVYGDRKVYRNFSWRISIINGVGKHSLRLLQTLDGTSPEAVRNNTTLLFEKSTWTPLWVTRTSKSAVEYDLLFFLCRAKKMIGYCCRPTTFQYRPLFLLAIRADSLGLRCEAGHPTKISSSSPTTAENYSFIIPLAYNSEG